MFRVVPLVLVLVALPAVAAPVPKSIKQNAAPSLEGTTWAGVHDGVADLGRIEYTFLPEGKISYKHANGSTYTQGSWKQEGSKLYWECNQKYAEFNLEFKDGQFEGNAHNVTGKQWKIILSPIEKK
ncbi:MAG: hypothetical protein ABGY75_05420 [Gemmataceae bacterium]